MNAKILAAVVLVFGIGVGAWAFLAQGADEAATEGQMSATEFSRESPLLLPDILDVVYDAFGQTEEAAIYDRLADVSSGPALEQLYLERVGAMAGGGLNPDQEIHEIELSGMSARSEGQRVTIDAKWRVLGVVGHAEHMHMRGNAYSADLVFEFVEDRWKITGFTLTDVDRTDAGTLERNKDAPPDDAAEASGDKT
ncbi:hypothetical protein ACOXXX_20545 [Thalassococcus sp. BH17M4-6]|uniref:hypothetical protein n=1 Tax=Thalassococcus sp. BH17M4-6 TaxID=3413148 RepID=UPI003BCEFF10